MDWTLYTTYLFIMPVTNVPVILVNVLLLWLVEGNTYSIIFYSILFYSILFYSMRAHLSWQTARSWVEAPSLRASSNRTRPTLTSSGSFSCSPWNTSYIWDFKTLEKMLKLIFRRRMIWKLNNETTAANHQTPKILIFSSRLVYAL